MRGTGEWHVSRTWLISANDHLTTRFLRDLRETCLSEPGNKDFWAQVQKQGRDISLISKPEAAKYGGISLIPESEAEGVSLILCLLFILSNSSSSSWYSDCFVVDAFINAANEYVFLVFVSHK